MYLDYHFSEENVLDDVVYYCDSDCVKNAGADTAVSYLPDDEVESPIDIDCNMCGEVIVVGK